MSWEQVPVGIARARRELREVLAEGPGQHDRGLTRMTPDPIWYPSHDRTTAHVPTPPFRPHVELLALLDALAGFLGGADDVESITSPAADGATLRVRLGTGTTIDIDLTEVPKC